MWKITGRTLLAYLCLKSHLHAILEASPFLQPPRDILINILNSW